MRQSVTEKPVQAQTIGCTDIYQNTKFRVFNLVLEHLELKNISAEKASRALVLDEIGQAVAAAAISEGVALNSAERSQLIEDVNHEIWQISW